jgi:hypothetical protein
LIHKNYHEQSHIENIFDITRDSECKLLFSFEIHSLIFLNEWLVEEIFFSFIILICLCPLIIILIFLKFHEHSAGCFDIVDLPWSDLSWRLKN